VKGNLAIILAVVSAFLCWALFGLSVTGLILDIVGVLFLLWKELKGETIMFRHNATKMDQGSWWEEIKRSSPLWQLIPLWIFKKIAPTDLMSANQLPVTESIPERFWALLLLIFGFFFQLLGTVVPGHAAANWVYVTPPWTFNVHDKYAGREFNSIPLNEWKQNAAFDSATRCEKARLFAYKILALPQADRESLLGLFAGGAEMRATQEAEPLIAKYQQLEGVQVKDPKLAAAVRDINWKLTKQWEGSKCVPLEFHRW
jgi:hypothetical protein